jgi:hypothetical protein
MCAPFFILPADLLAVSFSRPSDFGGGMALAAG